MYILKKIHWKDGKMLYIILWAGAILISLLMIGKKNDQKKSNDVFYKKFNYSGSSAEAINELLLSAGQLEIEEKKSFISLYLKPDEKNLSIGDKINTRDVVFKNIFQRKINQLKTNVNRKNEKFSIRPVPQ